ncbi:transposable element Tcb2 transposase [Trichonephila clavipes]|nr:transposable element Tcb2 transposase [Trichonephila clavipes]
MCGILWGRHVAGRNDPPTNKNTLIRALTEEWDNMPQQLLDNVVQSMVRRVECCITLYGGHIPSEIAIYKGLRFIDTASDLVFRGIWILTDSRDAPFSLDNCWGYDKPKYSESYGMILPAETFNMRSQVSHSVQLISIYSLSKTSYVIGPIVPWIREISFTRRPGSGCPRLTSKREDRHIVRNARVQPTASSVQVAPSIGTPVSSRTMRRHLAEGHLGSQRSLRLLPLSPTHRCLLLEWCHARENWTAAEWNQFVFSDESRFSLSSEDNRVRVWRPRGERLNPAFASYHHTAPTAGVMVWGAIDNNTLCHP